MMVIDINDLNRVCIMVVCTEKIWIRLTILLNPDSVVIVYGDIKGLC